MRFHYSRKHISLYSFAVFVLSFVFVLLIFTPITRAEEFSFVGSVDVSVPLVDGKTQYGPVTVTLTDFTTLKTQSSEILAVTPIENISGSTQGIVNFKYSFGNLSKADTYQVCIPTTSLCTPKIGPNEQNSYLNVGKTAIIANISVSIQNLKDNPNIIPVTAATPTTTSCSVEGIGWIVCPTLTFLGKISDVAFNFLASSFLSTNTSLLNTNPKNGTIATYNAWQIMRNIANVAFLIAFLIIIFSQITSIGITNYGIKKMFPKLIIAAVMVNLSFILCQIAVDLSNISGYSFKGLFSSLSQLMQTPDVFSPGNATGNGFGIAALIVAGLAGGVTLLFAMSVPVLISVVLALLMIVLILVARTALIVLLVIISPLAFVAYLLPNTEQYFKKWGKMFANLLLVFPIISVLFGAGSLAGYVIKASAGEDKVMQLVAIGVAIIPLFAVPSLLKNSMSAAGSIGTKLANISTKANGRIGNKVSTTSRLGTGWNEAMNFRQTQRQTRLARGRSNSSRLNRVLGGEGYAEYAAKRGESLANKEFEDSVTSAAITQQGKTGGDIAAIATGAVTASESERVAAIRNMMKDGSYLERRAVIAASHTATTRGKIAIRDGYYAKGDQQYFGSGLGTNILGSDAIDLDLAMKDTLLDGRTSAMTLVSDASAAKEINKAFEKLGETGREGVVKTRLATLANTALTSPGTREKVNGLIETELVAMREFAPRTTSAPPQTQPSPSAEEFISPSINLRPTQPSGLLDQYGNPLPPSQNNNPRP